MRGKLAFAGIVALGLAELALGAFAATTDVGPEYRAYYIDRTTGCLPREVPGTYALGTTVEPQSGKPRRAFDDILVCGFENSIPEGTWLRGIEGRLRFTLDDGAPGDLVLRLDASARVTPSFRQQLTVFANGQPVGIVTFDDKDPHQVEFLIPASARAAASGRLDIALRMQRLPHVEPTSKDSRLHSLLVGSIWLGPAD